MFRHRIPARKAESSGWETWAARGEVDARSVRPIARGRLMDEALDEGQSDRSVG
jgi:hypothetical protein